MNTFVPAGLAFARIIAALPVPFEDDEPRVPGTPRDEGQDEEEEEFA